jgi:hypothetical protein
MAHFARKCWQEAVNFNPLKPRPQADPVNGGMGAVRHKQAGGGGWHGRSVAGTAMTARMKRNDEVGDLIWLLGRLLPDEDAPEEELPRLRRPLLLAIIAALERVPKPRGNLSRKIRGRALVSESTARALALARKRKLMDNEHLSATEAELQAAEEVVGLFSKLTGRRLAPDTIRRIMQGS